MSDSARRGRWDSARTAYELNRNAARTVAAVSSQRLRKQPRDPSWSLALQGMVELMAQSIPAHCTSAGQLRTILEAATRLGTGRSEATAIVDAAGVPALWVGPAEAERVILYLHGGAYVCGSPWTHLSLLQQICGASAASVLAPDYRLAPEAPFPAALEDAWSAYWWLLLRGTPPGRIVVGGDSAGGGLTLALLVALRDAHAPLPAAAFCLSPWVDLAVTGRTVQTNEKCDYLNEPIIRQTAQMYAGEHDVHEALVSPLYADLHGLPPILIQVGSNEMLLDDARRVARNALEAGVPVDLEIWESMVHVWHFFFPIEPRARAAIRSVGRFVRAQTWNVTDNGPAH